MPELSNPHDHFFKEVLSRREAATEFVEKLLPETITRHLDINTLELVKDSFIDAELQEHLSDIIFRVHLEDGSASYIYILVEHKSSPDKFVAFQLLKYEVRIWDSEVKAGAKKLSPIFPVFFYHGNRQWNVPIEFAALVELRGKEWLSAYVPNFSYHLLDVTKYEDNVIKTIVVGAVLKVMLLLTKHIFKTDVRKRIGGILELLKQAPEQTGGEFLMTALKYLAQATERITTRDLDEAIRPLLKKEGGVMPTLAETWKAEGRQEGLQRGLQEGRQEGLQQTTLRQLEKRCGKLTKTIALQIRSLSVPQLERLSDALLDFTSLKDLKN